MPYLSGVHALPSGTKNITTLPGSVSNLVVSQNDSFSLNITFTAASAATSHEVRVAPCIRQVDAGGVVSAISTARWEAPLTVTSGGTITGLDPQCHYDVQCRGVNGTGNGPWTSSQQAQTATAAHNTTGSDTSFVASGDAYIDGLALGRWKFSGSPKILTYSFPTTSASYVGLGGFGYGNNEPATFEALTTNQKNNIRKILFLYQQCTALKFVETAESGIIRYGHCTDASAPAHAYFPGPGFLANDDSGGDVWFSYSLIHDTDIVPGTYAFKTALHETGHALGLKHPQGTAEDPNNGQNPAMPSDRDGRPFTVMSYKSYIGDAIDGDGDVNFVFTPQRMDIEALKYSYGSNTKPLSGTNVISWDNSTGAWKINGVTQITPSGGRIYMTVHAPSGDTTYDFSNYPAGTVTADLTAGGQMSPATNQKPAIEDGVSVHSIYNSYDTTIDHVILP